MSRGLLFIILAMSSIGISIPIGGLMMEKFPVFLFTCMTILIAGVILFITATAYEKTNWIKLGGKNYLAIFIQALLTVTMYTVFQLYGLTYASAVAVGIITSITPAVVLILAVFLLRERLNLNKITAIALAVVAVLIMEMAGVTPDGGSGGLGILFMILAVISMALFFIFAKKFSVEVQLPPFTTATGLCFFGALQTLPMAIYEFQSFDTAILADSATLWYILFYALTSWLFAYSFTFLALPRINASTAGMATACIPIVATVVAVAFFGAPIRIVDVIALILVIASIVIAERHGGAEEPPVDGTPAAPGAATGAK
ncbi:DMT family transporter [Bacillus piscicola]|uniref:DMT family transporter n=1 Tax=Bacillus piscicola TaxID=1632684 RepID=UPI001F08933F|nr:DMT family transporter [Bacillus piscicola]